MRKLEEEHLSFLGFTEEEIKQHLLVGKTELEIEQFLDAQENKVYWEGVRRPSHVWDSATAICPLNSFLILNPEMTKDLPAEYLAELDFLLKYFIRTSLQENIVTLEGAITYPKNAKTNEFIGVDGKVFTRGKELDRNGKFIEDVTE